MESGAECNGWTVINTCEEIDLEKTLFSGQVFSFQRTGECEYTGVVGEYLMSFMQKRKTVLYKVLYGRKPTMSIHDAICYFFTLDISMHELVTKWKFDGECLSGLRMLRNELVPTIFSFVCSSNNNIPRITRMVWFLYSKGEFIMEYKGFRFHYFPSVDRLVGIEDELKANGFGYRARYVCDAAEYLKRGSESIVSGADCRKALLGIRGIGRKVADCILLIGLGRHGVVPIDTHMLNHAKKHFGICANGMSDKTYDRVQQMYVSKYGKYAGIAQLYIFKMMIDIRSKKTARMAVHESTIDGVQQC
ncbi:putative 8-oxoguanine DNA glycosylase [Ordospora pajunii]|uniref:putative 8-oxoguanine DNA glycosylase n=1 Tax=Ordospora pajunii TaxID=3039483 RepID=UPI002952660E|nr:putative 8-oxoguanine DNA glycosylase [Ordospora pajunii]KAH9411015.1 putative 8-oxoguanine DNA glycosylase [Ordospora pajunii]